MIVLPRYCAPVAFAAALILALALPEGAFAQSGVLNAKRSSFNDGLRNQCAEQLKRDYGGEEVEITAFHRRDDENKRIEARVKRKDGSTATLRCVVRGRGVSKVQSPAGSGWTTAEKYVAPPEEAEAADDTAPASDDDTASAEPEAPSGPKRARVN